MRNSLEKRIPDPDQTGGGLESNGNEKILEKKRELLPPIFFVYRDNEFYKKYLSLIKEKISLPGRKVEEFSFPQGTPEEEIQKWSQDNQDKILNSVILSDNTCTRQGIKSDSLGKEGLTSNRSDSTFLDAIRLASFDDLFEKEGNKLSPFNRVENVISKVLENKGNKPKKVYIIEKQLNDHGGCPEIDNEIIQNIQNELKDKGFNIDALGDRKGMLTNDHYYAISFKKMLEEKGIKNVKIIEPKKYNTQDEYFDFSQENYESFEDSEDVWIINDSHYWNNYLKSSKFKELLPKKTKVLQSDPYGIVSTCVENNLFDEKNINLDSYVEDKINKSLESYYSVNKNEIAEWGDNKGKPKLDSLVEFFKNKKRF